MTSTSVLQTSNKILFIFLFSLIISQNAFCQNLIGVVDYMKVENEDQYLEMEYQWKKIHEERLKEGQIRGWAVYQIMFKTAEDPYNFVTISLYDAMSKLGKKVPRETMEAAYPGKSKDDWKEFDKATEDSRKLVSSGVFHQQLSTSPDSINIVNYYVVNEINVKPGKSKEYLQIEEEIYLPLHMEDVKNNNRLDWSLWAKWPGNMKDFQYVSADAYKDLDQITQPDYISYFEKIHPGVDSDEISEKIEELRILVNTEMWKMIYCVNP